MLRAHVHAEAVTRCLHERLTQRRSSCLLLPPRSHLRVRLRKHHYLEEYSTPLCLIRLPTARLSYRLNCCVHTALTLFRLTQRYRANPSRRGPGKALKTALVRARTRVTLFVNQRTRQHHAILLWPLYTERARPVTNPSNHERKHFLLPRSLNIARLHGEPLALAAICALALSLRSLASILAWDHRRLFDHTAGRKAERTHEGLIVEPKLRLLS